MMCSPRSECVLCGGSARRTVFFGPYVRWSLHLLISVIWKQPLAREKIYIRWNWMKLG
jgi:hypothetical protein